MRTFIAPSAFAVIAALSGCASMSSGNRPSQDVGARVSALADDYVKAYFEFSPIDATFEGVSSPRHDDRWDDNSLEALARWHDKEDGLLAQVAAIDPTPLAGRPEWVTYGVLREQLETSVALRVCREELWYTRGEIGLSEGVTYLAAAQPVDSPAARERTLARWRDFARFLDVEIRNLKVGLDGGYAGEKGNVRRLIGQMDSLLNDPIEKTSLYEPAKRANDAQFNRQLSALITNDVRPALKRYRDFLEGTYLPRAREPLSVAATPGGVACYQAFLRAGNSLIADPEEIHRIGLEQIQKAEEEMRTIAKRSFQTEDVAALLQKLRTDKAFLLDNAGRLKCGRDSIARAKQAAARVFGLLPRTELEVREREGGGASSYQNPPDKGLPAFYWVASDTEARLICETTAFHEGIPGHHLQLAIARERGEALHPIARYFTNTAFAEGWALYSERLADELGLFSEDIYRLGMLAEQSFRAARLVVDTGLHAKGWSRERAIDYMLAHSAESRKTVEEEIDRYIGWPGQATGYMIGMLEIRRLREQAQAKLGTRFDLKQFHDRVLEDGNVTLPMLRAKIERWLAEAR